MRKCWRCLFSFLCNTASSDMMQWNCVLVAHIFLIVGSKCTEKKMKMILYCLHVHEDTQWNLFSAFDPPSTEEQRAAAVQRSGIRSRSSSAHFVRDTDFVWGYMFFDCGGNQRRHGENTRTPQSKALPAQGLNLGPCCWEATVLTSVSLCRVLLNCISRRKWQKHYSCWQLFWPKKHPLHATVDPLFP